MTLPEQPPSPPVRSPRVLYVEDEPSLRDVVAEVLRRQGFAVDTASDGIEGWNRICTDRPGFDLVITDRQMPRLDGVALVRRLRHASFPGRIIVYTAAVTPGCLEELKPLSVDAIVPKGATMATLLAAIAKVIRTLP